MWYSYLLAEHQNKFRELKPKSSKMQWSVNLQILNRCYRRQTSTISRKAVMPHVLISNFLTKMEKTEQVNQNHCIQLKKQYLSSYSKQDSSSKIFSSKTTKKNLKVKKIKKTTRPKIQKGKNPGRNSTSNIFRVFIKLCSKSNFENIIKQKVIQACNTNEIDISFQQFKQRIYQLAPSTSNYINFREFQKIWSGSCKFSRLFRSIFHWFLSSFGIIHSLTLKGKHKMMRESIIHFLTNLRQIQQQLLSKQDQQVGEDIQDEGNDKDCQDVPVIYQ